MQYLKNLLFILVIVAWLLAACSPTATPVTVTQEATAVAEPTSSPAGPIPTSTLPATPSPAPTATPAPPPPGLVAGGTVIVGLTQEPASLNPLLSSTSIERAIRSFIVEGLVGVDTRGQYVPVLAENLPTISADGRVLTYKIRPGIRFSNGDAFVCADVQFTLEAILSADTVIGPVGYGDIRSLECLDDYTAVVNFTRYYAPYLNLFSYIIPRAAGSPAELKDWEYNRNPIGTGPWTVKEWIAGDSITLVKNPYYRETGKPYLDSVLLKILPSHEVGLQLLDTGKITVLWGMSEADFPALEEMPDASFAGALYGSGENELIVFNLADPALDAPLDATTHPHPILYDLRVRQAIQYAINKQELVDKLLKGKVRLASTVLPAGPFACPQPPSEFSLEQARTLLDEAGWVPGEDGIRTKDGVRMSLRIASISGEGIREQTEQALVEMLKQAGIELTIENVIPDAFFSGWDANNLRKHGQFDLLLYTTGPDTDPDSHLFNNYHSLRIPIGENGGVGSNYSRYFNPDVDAWIDEAATTVDTARRAELYCKVAAQINKDLPRLFLYERQFLSGYRTALQNFHVSPGPAGFTIDSQNWWMKP